MNPLPPRRAPYWYFDDREVDRPVGHYGRMRVRSLMACVDAEIVSGDRLLTADNVLLANEAVAAGMVFA